MQPVGSFREAIERPDFHCRDARLEKRLRQLVGAMQESFEILIRTFGGTETPVGAGLLPRVTDVPVTCAGVVRADRIAARAAEHLVERLAAYLAVQVPQRNVERGHSARLHTGAAEAEVAGELTLQTLDLERVPSQHARCNEFVEVRLHALGCEAR